MTPLMASVQIYTLDETLELRDYLYFSTIKRYYISLFFMLLIQLYTYKKYKLLLLRYCPAIFAFEVEWVL